MPALSSVRKSEDLSVVEVRVLEYLARTLRPGFCPSREELSQAAGLGTRGSSITNTLRDLEAKGYLDLGEGRSRSITLHRTADGKRFGGADVIRVPVAGQIANHGPAARERAGRPGGQAAVNEAIELARSMLGGRENVYALKVRGQAMSDALVNDGDVVVLARTTDIKNGELAAVRVTGKDGCKTTTLKYIYHENGHVRLQPVHPDMPPLFYKPEHVAVQGRVVLVIRQLG